MKYFAYGSNMDKDRMNRRGVQFSSREFAKLSGYKLVFNKKSQNGDFAYANIVPSVYDYVEGVLYEISDQGLSVLDRYEGYPDHYDRKKVEVQNSKGETIQAETYIANPTHIEEGLCPTRKYLNHLLAARDLLSPEYIKKLEQTRTC
jgi:cation transport regulator ChaC